MKRTKRQLEIRDLRDRDYVYLKSAGIIPADFETVAERVVVELTEEAIKYSGDAPGYLSNGEIIKHIGKHYNDKKLTDGYIRECIETTWFAKMSAKHWKRYIKHMEGKI